MNILATVITKNEDTNNDHCLKYFRYTDVVVAVDSKNRDGLPKNEEYNQYKAGSK